MGTSPAFSKVRLSKQTSSLNLTARMRQVSSTRWAFSQVSENSGSAMLQRSRYTTLSSRHWGENRVYLCSRRRQASKEIQGTFSQLNMEWHSQPSLSIRSRSRLVVSPISLASSGSLWGSAAGREQVVIQKMTNAYYNLASFQLLALLQLSNQYYTLRLFEYRFPPCVKVLEIQQQQVQQILPFLDRGSMENNFFHQRRHSVATETLKQRIVNDYLPKYKEKLQIQNKKLLEPSEDRLSQLTTKQIDRLIEMEKIKSLLNDNKKGYRPTYIDFDEGDPARHPNVYQPNFMAKINRIAVERNIRQLRSEEFEEAVMSPKELRQKGLNLQKKNLRFVKQYRADAKKKQKRAYEQKQQKSISSIDEQIEEFEQNLEKSKLPKTSQTLHKFKHKQTNILSTTRWFNGMSTYYLGLGKGNQASKNIREESSPGKCSRSMNQTYYSSFGCTRSDFKRGRLLTSS